MATNMYGYARVSTRSQKEDRQLIALQEFGVASAHIIVEKQSGKNFARPLYQQLIQALQPGDVLVVKSIDRLGRNYSEILEQWTRITKTCQAAIVVLDMPLLDRIGATGSSPPQRRAAGWAFPAKPSPAAPPNGAGRRGPPSPPLALPYAAALRA